MYKLDDSDLKYHLSSLPTKIWNSQSVRLLFVGSGVIILAMFLIYQTLFEVIRLFVEQNLSGARKFPAFKLQEWFVSISIVLLLSFTGYVFSMITSYYWRLRFKWLAIGGVITLFHFAIFRFAVFKRVAVEDGILEWLTVILAFFAAGMFLLVAKRVGWGALVLAAAFLLFAYEEMSWGQRVFGIETPLALKEMNYQQEINLHNFFNPIIKSLYYLFHLLAFLGLTWFRRISLLDGIFGQPSVKKILRVSDQFGFWIVPVYLGLGCYYLRGPEFAEQHWALMGLIFSILLYTSSKPISQP